MRTSHKEFVPQLAAIERRQARIRRIRTRQEISNTTDPTPDVPEQHHVIGKSQNFPEEINSFLLKNSHNPAAKVALLYLSADTFYIKLDTGLSPEAEDPPSTPHP